MRSVWVPSAYRALVLTLSVRRMESRLTTGLARLGEVHVGRRMVLFAKGEVYVGALALR